MSFCNFVYTVDGFRESEIKLAWGSSGQVDVKEGLSLPEFVLDSVTADTCKANYATGEWEV